jgi:hypothetical protein
MIRIVLNRELEEYQRASCNTSRMLKRVNMSRAREFFVGHVTARSQIFSGRSAQIVSNLFPCFHLMFFPLPLISFGAIPQVRL